MFKNSKLQSYLLIYFITFSFFTFFKIFKIDLMIEHIAEIIFMILTLIIICRIDNPFNPEKIKQYSKIDKPKLTKILIISAFVIFILITYGLTINGRYIKKTLDILPISQRLFYFFLFFISGFFEEILIKWCLFQELAKTKMPTWVSITLVSFLFYVLHGEIDIRTFIATFLYQAITLLAYRKYPNILFFGVFHWLRNFTLFV